MIPKLGLRAGAGGWSFRVDPSQRVAGRGQDSTGGRPRVVVEAQRGTQIRQGGLLDDRDALGAFVGGPRVVVTLDAAEPVFRAEQGQQIGGARAEAVAVGEPVRTASAGLAMAPLRTG
jgi:hypothetical protein